MIVLAIDNSSLYYQVQSIVAKQESVDFRMVRLHADRACTEILSSRRCSHRFVHIPPGRNCDKLRRMYLGAQCQPVYARKHLADAVLASARQEPSGRLVLVTASVAPYADMIRALPTDWTVEVHCSEALADQNALALSAHDRMFCVLSLDARVNKYTHLYAFRGLNPLAVPCPRDAVFVPGPGYKPPSPVGRSLPSLDAPLCFFTRISCVPPFHLALTPVHL